MDTATEAASPNFRARIERLEELVNNHADRLQEHRDDISGLSDELGISVRSDRTPRSPKPERAR